jgi:hypothetical protein
MGYQAQLASHTIGETFGPAAAFLKLAAADAQATTDTSVQGRTLNSLSPGGQTTVRTRSRQTRACR